MRNQLSFQFLNLSPACQSGWGGKEIRFSNSHDYYYSLFSLWVSGEYLICCLEWKQFLFNPADGKKKKKATDLIIRAAGFLTFSVSSLPARSLRSKLGRKRPLNDPLVLQSGKTCPRVSLTHFWC